jgi:hypothetical protein
MQRYILTEVMNEESELLFLQHYNYNTAKKLETFF